MSLSSQTIDALVAAGATAEMLAAAFKAELAAEAEKRAARREGARVRKQRQRERDGINVTRDVRDDAGQSVTERDNLPLSPSSPKPPSSTNPNQVPPYSPPSQQAAEPDLKAIAEQIWLMQPVVGGKRRSTRPDVLKALRAVDRRGNDPARAAAACQAYYRLPDCRKDGGQFASGAAVILAEDRWRDFEAQAAATRPAPKPEGAVYAAHVRHFRETGEWRSAWGDKPDLEAAA